jgi:hypothetical protein
MALEGSIKEFGLADILQLIYYQKKTGMLLIEGPIDRVKVYFNEGNVVTIKSAKRPEDNRLGRILLKKEIITEKDLAEVLEEQKNTGVRLGAILIKRGLVTREALTEIIERQIIDQIVHLFSWKEGTYEFLPQGVPVDKDIGISLDTQHILMEGLRIVDEWSVIEGMLTLDTIFRKTAAGLAEEDSPELDDFEKEVLSLVDGENDVSSIVELSSGDDFAISKMLVQFLERGWIEPVVEGAEVREEIAKSRLPYGLIISMAVPVLLLIALGVSGLTILLQSLDMFGRASTSSMLSSLREEVELYRMQKGEYPERLPSSSRDEWGREFIYQKTDSGYVLFSPGPDGKSHTGDDIY